jgi:hypothetical protein
VSGFEALDRFEQALAVDDGENLDRLVSQFVNQTIAVDEAFAHSVVVQFGHDATELGVDGLFIGEIEQTLDDLLGIDKGSLVQCTRRCYGYH